MSRPVRLYRKTECCSHGNAKTAPTGTGSPKGAFFDVTHSTGLVNRSLPVAGLVPRRPGRAGTAAAAVHLARTRRPEVHLLVPPSRPPAAAPPATPPPRARAGGATR